MRLVPDEMAASSAELAITERIAEAYTCLKCEEPTTLADSYPAGGSGQVWKRKCRQCKSAQNSLDNRSKKNPLLKKAFKRKSAEQQAQWFRDQKRLRTDNKSQRYNFDNLTFDETERRTTGEEMRQRVLWKDYGLFKQTETSKAIMNGDLNASDSGAMELFEGDLQRQWMNLLESDTALKKQIGNVWHVRLVLSITGGLGIYGPF